MSFTDDDLKQVKRHFAACKDACQTCTEMRFPALVARLEAAEAVLTDDCPADAECEFCRKHHAAYMAWRKAAGK